MEFHEQELILPEEDDVFYSEMRKQLLHLTEDDEESEATRVEEGYCLWVGKVAFPPALNLQRPVTGTGVFIPQGFQSKPRNRSRRKSRARKQKQMEKV